MAYVRTRLGRWFYEERGAARREGDAAVLLWPSLLFDGAMWRGQVEPLAAFARVVVLDPPGHGKSEVPPPFSLEDAADALLDLLGALKIDRTVFVGHSWGGMVGLRMALQHASRVRALAVLNTSAEAEEPAKRVRYRLLVSFARRFGLPPQLVDRQLAPLFFCERTRREHPELVERWARAANGFPRVGIARGALAVSRRTDLTPRVGSIAAPVLVLGGKEDRAIDPACSERLASRIPGAQLRWIENAGHSAAIEQPAAVNDVLVPFVRDHVG